MRYEYLWVPIRHPSAPAPQEELDNYGSQGWRVVTVLQDADGKLTALLERRI
jgi:hypothetical protein